MKTTKLLICFFLIAISSSLFSQSYNSAIGLRFGYPTAVSYKTFLSEKNAIEAFVGFRSYGFGSFININAAYQIHNPIASVDNLSWYYGLGAGAYLYSYDAGVVDDGSFGIGVSGYLGLDYKFDNIPLNLSADWVPTFFLGGGYYNGFGGSYGALSARYILSPKS